MSQLLCTARRIGDYQSRTEEYELAIVFSSSSAEVLQIKYQAARAYEINAALDACVEASRAAVAGGDERLAEKLTDQSLSLLCWKTIQSAKYEEGEPRSSTLSL